MRGRLTKLMGGLALALLGALVLTSYAGAETFSANNNNGTSVPGTGTSGQGDPYPSMITVTGHAGTITDLNVSLAAVNHQNPDDMDVVLVGPTGIAVFLMSDACNGDASVLRPLSFDDAGASFLSDNSSCPSSNNPYRPSNFDGAPESYISPGPIGTAQQNALAAFNGTNPDGTWNLFAQDDNSAAGGGGAIGGWTLNFTSTPTTTTPVTTTTPTPAAVATPTVLTAICGGKSATIVGTSGADALTGTAAADVIAGLGGKDTIRGLAGNDVLCGGGAKDRLIGGGGNDSLLGGGAKDTLIGGKGTDALKGGAGKDVQTQRIDWLPGF